MGVSAFYSPRHILCVINFSLSFMLTENNKNNKVINNDYFFNFGYEMS